MRLSSRVEALLSELPLQERCLLTAGRDMSFTQLIASAGIPLVRLTDGPNGARGPRSLLVTPDGGDVQTDRDGAHCRVVWAEQ